MGSQSSERYLEGQRVEIIGVADYNGQRGIVAWTEESGERLGVWLDSQDMAGTDMPVTFLRSEVVRYGPLESVVKHYCRICGGQVISECGWIDIDLGRFWVCPRHQENGALLRTDEVGWVYLVGSERFVLGPYPYEPTGAKL